MILSYLKLALCALLPPILSIILVQIENRKGINKAERPLRLQILYGFLFGLLAILGTEWGIPLRGAMLNSRDSAVICAGLFFGAPAGLVAGIIGGLERWFSVYWGVGAYTRVACSLSTFIAGVLSAVLRKHMFENRRPGVLISGAIGAVIEVFHMVMVFLTNMNDPARAMSVVRICAAPMIIANGASVLLAALFLNRCEKHARQKKPEKPHISQSVQRWLLIAILTAFAMTSFFVVRLQNELSRVQTDQMLERANSETIKDMQDASDQSLVTVAWIIAESYQEGSSLKELGEDFGLSEISIIDKKGVITRSTIPGFVGFDMKSGPQSAAFLSLLTTKTEYVQDYGPIQLDGQTQRKYAGVRLNEGGFLQVGYDVDSYRHDMAETIRGITKNHEVGATGFVVLFDRDGTILSAPLGHESELRSQLTVQSGPEGETFEANVLGSPSYCRRDLAEGYTIISVLPVEEANQLRTIAIYVNTFMEILVFAILFALAYILIQQIVVRRIHQVNASLNVITAGDLNEVVNVRTNQEFVALSDDINSTVDTLKTYIAEASARIDQELEVARNIQASALPRIFENITGRNDVDLHATMHTAKEVGGDFYDFYMTNGNSLNFLIADVSGKGIPAAMFMMRSKTELKNMTEAGVELDQAFIRANHDLCTGNDADMFVTAWQGCLNLDTGEVRYVNAGHNRPLVRHGDGDFEYIQGRVNFILGGMDGVRYTVQTLQLQSGDTLFLYTDGVTEATDANNQLYGDDRLQQFLSQGHFSDMKELCASLKEDIDRFVGEAPQFDDITMVALKYNGTGPAWCRDFAPASLDDIPSLTAEAEEELERLEAPMKVVMQLSVAIDEIYSNIVKYAYPGGKTGPAHVEIRKVHEPEGVQMTFRDQGLPYNPLTNADPDTTLSAEERKIGGLGIYIVRNTMDEVRYLYENDENIFILRKNY